MIKNLLLSIFLILISGQVNAHDCSNNREFDSAWKDWPRNDHFNLRGWILLEKAIGDVVVQTTLGLKKRKYYRVIRGTWKDEYTGVELVDIHSIPRLLQNPNVAM
jgi:hypothetical protein